MVLDIWVYIEFWGRYVGTRDYQPRAPHRLNHIRKSILCHCIGWLKIRSLEGFVINPPIIGQEFITDIQQYIYNPKQPLFFQYSLCSPEPCSQDVKLTLPSHAEVARPSPSMVSPSREKSPLSQTCKIQLQAFNLVPMESLLSLSCVGKDVQLKSRRMENVECWNAIDM